MVTLFGTACHNIQYQKHMMTCLNSDYLFQLLKRHLLLLEDGRQDNVLLLLLGLLVADLGVLLLQGLQFSGTILKLALVLGLDSSETEQHEQEQEEQQLK